MKVVKKANFKLEDDPRDIRDLAIFHNIMDMVEDAALNPCWVCVLWRLHRFGVLTLAQRMAGDTYLKKYRDFAEIQDSDPEELIPEARDLAYRRVNKRKKEMRAAWDILGPYRSVVHSVVVDDCWPAGYAIMYEDRKDLGSESERTRLITGLQLLSDFFCNGRTNRVRKKA